ncbi:hypothetical protein [Priestia megaterium]|uniref:hypothetical protein n=1 Tax=Priestia megaterium TaxID=1404 RepID=UPI0013EBADEC|nr:hypothetical protein [Priestia megaterium]
MLNIKGVIACYLHIIYIFVDIYYNPSNHFEKVKIESDYLTFELKGVFSISYR